MRRIERMPVSDSGSVSSAHGQGQQDDRQPPAEADRLREELDDRLGEVLERLEDDEDRERRSCVRLVLGAVVRASCARRTGGGRRARRRRRRSTGCSGSTRQAATIVPRTIPSSRTACTRVGRAARVVPTARLQVRRDQPAVGMKRQQEHLTNDVREAARLAATVSRVTPSIPRFGEQLAQRRRRLPGVPSRSTRPAESGLATSTKS